MDLIIREGPAEVAEAAATRVAALIAGGGDRFTLGLAGGSTPAATYRELRSKDVGWGRVDAWLSDERWVPHDHERSNGRMAREELLDHVDARLHRPEWLPDADADTSARLYEQTLDRIIGDRRPDVIMLGVGPDGHTASLFPGSTAETELSRRYVSTFVELVQETRLTATYPLLWSAKLLVIVTCGPSKAEAVAACFAGDKPAGRLGEGDAEVEWYVDKEAASLIA